MRTGGPGSTERWREIERLLDRALDLPPNERPALLERECAGDTGLRAAVDQMLLACERS